MSKIEIDLNRLKDNNGNYSEAAKNTIEQGTGKLFSEVIESADTEYSDEQIKNMSDAEYEKNRDKILEQLAKA